MAKVRCKETRVDTFFGNSLYDQKVSRSHFLRKLSEVVDCDRFTGKLLGYYRGKDEIGQAPYNPAIMLKMLKDVWVNQLRSKEKILVTSIVKGEFKDIALHDGGGLNLMVIRDTQSSRKIDFCG